MKRLVAHYNLRLTTGVIIKRPEGDLPSYRTKIDAFEVVISLSPESTGAKKSQDEQHFTRDVTGLQVTCGRDEDEAPPQPAPTSSGGKDYTVQADYFDTREGEYATATMRALDRFFAFLRYSLHQPSFGPVRSHRTEFGNPTWRDEADNDVGHGRIGFVVQRLPTGFGVIPLQQSHDSEITQRLSSDYSPELYEDFLADAQSAAFDENVSRAVVELAIACEVAIKHTFFGQTTASASALTIEHLEDKNRLRLRVVELIHTTSKDVFGVSFCELHEPEYRHIEELFRCRNKVAHRGCPNFKDQDGTLHEATLDTCERWFASVRVMMNWLKRLHV